MEPLEDSVPLPYNAQDALIDLGESMVEWGTVLEPSPSAVDASEDTSRMTAPAIDHYPPPHLAVTRAGPPRVRGRRSRPRLQPSS